MGLDGAAEPHPHGRHTPEPEKKGGLAGWGRLDPEEVLEDQTGAGKRVSADFMQPESESFYMSTLDAMLISYLQNSTRLGHS